MLNGLLSVNIELSSICNKNCWMCGRRKIDKEYPELAVKYGFMDFQLLQKISKELPESIVIQFHNNGEPLLYPRLGEALSLFNKQIRCLDTNGKLLIEKKEEIVENLDSITISTFENDDEWEHQYETVLNFLEYKKNKKPFVVIRCLGNISEDRRKKYENLNCRIANRILHSPLGSFGYSKKTVVPETGICLEILSKMAINIEGEVSICVRFDPHRKGIIGSIKENTLTEIWNGSKRQSWLKHHISNKREQVPLCEKCEFWGIPRGDM